MDGERLLAAASRVPHVSGVLDGVLMTELDRACPACHTAIPPASRSCPSCGALSLPRSGSGSAEDILARLGRALGQRYRIDRELGHGGMAIVYLAQELRHSRLVAIKVLHPELAPFLGDERFLREINISAQLTHPHIVPLYDSGEADGLLYYVMPYIEGDSLRQRLERDLRLPIVEAVRVAREVADGLSFAHDLGVVHRDIKPENVLLAHGNAMIADFGIARAVYATGAGVLHTTGGITLGTPQYMSPEQSAGETSLDHRTDIYSLGCVLYEALTGRTPYSGAEPMALVSQHACAPVPSAHAVRPDVPTSLDAVVQRAMAKLPDDRYSTAAAFSAALAPFALPAPSSPGRWSAWNPRRPLRLLAAAVVLLTCAGAATFAWRRAARFPASAPQRTLSVLVRHFDERGEGLRPIADKITESLTDRLIAIPVLHVTTSAVVSELREASLDSLRARFHPDRFVTGMVEAVPGDSLSITVELVDPATSRSIARGHVTVPRGGGGPAAATDSLSVIVRRALWVELERDQRRARVSDSAAWTMVERAGDLVTTGMQAVSFRLDPGGLHSFETADSLLARARQRDKNSDLIPVEQARLAERRAFVLEYLAQRLPTLPADLPRPDIGRTGALAILDPLIRARGGPADALELRGLVKRGLFRTLKQDSLLDAAIDDLRTATELDLHRASAWKELALSQKDAGLHADALLSVERAFKADVFQLYRVELLRTRFDAALRAGEYDTAGDACAAWRVEASRDQRLFDCELELWSRTRSDRRTLARAIARADSLSRAGNNAGLLPAMQQLYVAEILARAGLGDSADAVAERAQTLPRATWRPLLNQELAYLRLLRGDADSAVALIAGLVRENPTIKRSIAAQAWFAPLRNDARFAAMLQAGSPSSSPPERPSRTSAPPGRR